MWDGTFAWEEEEEEEEEEKEAETGTDWEGERETCERALTSEKIASKKEEKSQKLTWYRAQRPRE